MYDFRDLTLYKRTRTPQDVTMLNIGWLSKEHSYKRGLFKDRGIILNKLIAYMMSEYDVHRMRGHEPCIFCGAKHEVINLKDIWLASSEIWIPGKQGIVYGSPAMIIHYILVHFYQPPEEYIDAVKVYNPDTWDVKDFFDNRFK